MIIWGNVGHEFNFFIPVKKEKRGAGVLLIIHHNLMTIDMVIHTLPNFFVCQNVKSSKFDVEILEDLHRLLRKPAPWCLRITLFGKQAT
jgi:hypothetical protein